MFKYWDWKLDDKANSIVWIKEIDGEIKVVMELDGWWKADNDVVQVVDRVDPNVLSNSQHEVTNTCAGQAALQQWDRLGRPTKEPVAPSPAYIANISPCPESIAKHDIRKGCMYDACMYDGSITDDVRAEFGVEEAE